MFAQVAGTVPIALPTACVALNQAIHDGGLTLASQRACEESAEFLMRVRPTERLRISRRVRVQLLPARTVKGVLTVPFRWEATGPAGRLFPSVDANLALSPAGEGVTTVTVTASYRPPLGRFGEAMDQTLLAGLAECTLTAMVREVSAKLVLLATTARDDGLID
jgi:hypothetical protein